jgi:hypothetical protein
VSHGRWGMPLLRGLFQAVILALVGVAALHATTLVQAQDIASYEPQNRPESLLIGPSTNLNACAGFLIAPRASKNANDSSPIKVASCALGWWATNDGWCIPPYANNCGGGRYCPNSGQCCSGGCCAQAVSYCVGGHCIPYGANYCGGGRYCTSGRCCDGGMSCCN